MDTSPLSSTYSDYYSQLATNANASALSSKLEGASQKSDDELMAVCKEFESYLMEQVFKNMQKTTKIFSEDDSDPNDQLIDFFKDKTIQELSSQATEQNSVGLAQMLYDQMKINMGISPNQLAQNMAEQVGNQE